jgi:hypothetical protein
VRLGSASADAEQKGHEAAKAIDGDPKTGWGVAVGGDWHVRRVLRLGFESPLKLPGGGRIEVRLDQQHGSRHLLGRLRLSVGEPLRDTRPESERREELVERAFRDWRARERGRTRDWELLEPVSARSEVPWLTILPDGSVLASGDQTKSDTYEVRYRGDLTGVTAIRLEALPDERLPHGGPGRVHYEGPPGEFFLSEIRAVVDGGAVRFVGATESYARVTDGTRYRALLALDGDAQSGWSTSGREGEASHAVFQLGEPLAGGAEMTLELLFERYYAAGLGRFRVWVTRDPRGAEARDVPVEMDELFRRSWEGLSATEQGWLRRQFWLTASELASAQKEIRDRRRGMPAYPTTLVLAERGVENPRPTHIHHRGEFMEPGDRVEAGVPSVLPDLSVGVPRNRLGLARWLVSREHPLTARVVVNRQWAVLFGKGLVRTAEDFGFQGELPTHPELLDWLAVEFMEDGWSLKRLHRMLVLSATYRQSSRVTPDRLERDPDNRWLARMPRLRLEAELVRDAVLRAGGLLSGKMGGPSVFPPQPPGITTEGAYGPLEWKVSEGTDRYRRGLYTFMKRTAPYAMFATFDAPSGEACVARREASNTPLQALTGLNDEVVMEAAVAAGRWAAAQPGRVEEKAARLFERCLARTPTRAERRMLVEFWEAQHARFAAGEVDAAELAGVGEEGRVERAAWVALARVLMNLDEFLVRS